MKLLLPIILIFSLMHVCHLTAKHESTKCDAKNCVLPLCKCSNGEVPGNIDLEETPMMVGLTFNGILTSHTMRFVKRILNPVFKNPNGCPVQATFFLSHEAEEKTEYCLVQSLFNNNNEIGVGGVKYE